MKSPTATSRKKHFRGRGLWDLGAAVGADSEGEAGDDCGFSRVALSEEGLSTCLSGEASFLTGTIGVCFL